MGSRIETPLRRALREDGRKQVWLAERVGATEPLMSRWVHGLIPPDDKREAIAEALGRNVDELWPSTEVAA